MKTKIISLYGGPSAGKSTVAGQLFGELKAFGVNCEYVQEYAKDKAWEHSEHGATNLPKILKAQELVFAKQHFRIRRCAKEVDLIITDSPLLLSLAYIKDDFDLPGLKEVVLQAHNLYDHHSVFLQRSKPYNPKGRFQNEEEAKALDVDIRKIMEDLQTPFLAKTFHRRKTYREIIQEIADKWGSDIPALKEVAEQIVVEYFQGIN